LSDVSSTFASDINDNGVVVGQSGNQAVAWYGQEVVRLVDQLVQAPGWQLLRANAINQRGQITGIGINPSGEARAWILTPITCLHFHELCTPPRVSGARDQLNKLVGQIVVGGGGIVITQDGKVIHVDPPVPDAVTSVSGAIDAATFYEMLAADRSAHGVARLRNMAAVLRSVGSRAARGVLERH
jgi:hypothetical protein